MKKYLLGLLTGLIIVGSISAVAYQMNATQITYEPKDSNWKVNTVKGAIDDIKENCNSGGTSIKNVAKVISGDKNTVGSVVKIGDEEFYIIGKGNIDAVGQTKLLAKYSLKDNHQVTTGGSISRFFQTKYWIGNIGSGKQYTGSYSGSPYPYVYDENSNLYPIINAYAEKIKNLGISNVIGRVLSYEEASALSTDIRKSAGTDYYWLGSVANDDHVYCIWNDGTFSWTGWDTDKSIEGIRPVILIPTDEIN